MPHAMQYSEALIGYLRFICVQHLSSSDGTYASANQFLIFARMAITSCTNHPSQDTTISRLAAMTTSDPTLLLKLATLVSITKIASLFGRFQHVWCKDTRKYPFFIQDLIQVSLFWEGTFFSSFYHPYVKPINCNPISSRTRPWN